MEAIPGSASLIFEFNNEKSFYDIFNGNALFASIAGKQRLADMDVLRHELVENTVLQKYFTGQNIYISVHPSKTDTLSLLLTISAEKGFDATILNQLSKTNNSGLLITPLRISNKQGFNIYIKALKKRFYIVDKADNIFSGSFSKQLAEESAAYNFQKGKASYSLFSDQQNANTLANLYVNYDQLTPLFDLFFRNKSTDIYKTFKLLPALASLSLNYRSDALMFNGITTIKRNEAMSYLTLFANQQPITNHLKEIFPSTTAYSTSFSLSDPATFQNDLEDLQNKAGLKNEKKELFRKMKAETGVNLVKDFNKMINNEFAVVTTRYFEKFGIVPVKDGSKLKALLVNISTMNDENTGQLNYDKVPFFLLGDAFSVFKRPFFTIIDNYLVLANSAKELVSYNDMYINQKFLSISTQYNQFDNLLAAKSNVSFFINFKNAQPILERDMYPEIFKIVKSSKPGWSDFYGQSIQFSGSEKNLYTNFCLKINTDTTSAKN